MKITLKWDGDSGDGKRAFVVAKENDGWKDLRIEADIDDCDKKYAKQMMQEVINRCNYWNTKKGKKTLYLLFVIGLCGCNQSVKYEQGNDYIQCYWSGYSNVTITAVRDGKGIQIGSPKTFATFTPLEDKSLDIGPPMTVVKNVRVCAPVTNIVICSDFVGTFQLGAKFYPLQ